MMKLKIINRSNVKYFKYIKFIYNINNNFADTRGVVIYYYF